METNKLTTEEIRGYELPRLKELEGEIRNELLNIRMDIYQTAAANLSKKRTLRKNLARVMHVKSEKRKLTDNKSKKEGKQ